MVRRDTMRSMQVNHVNFEPSRIADICQRYHARRLSLFGSILTERFRQDSDVDMLVEFDPAAKVSLFDLGGMLMELQATLGREVDLRTPRDLSRHFRDDVVRSARTIYAA